jgi:hypothetical protein
MGWWTIDGGEERNMTTPRRSWGIQIAAAALTGAAVWAFMAWRGTERALLLGVLCGGINLAFARLWPGEERKDSGVQGSQAPM